MKLDDVREMTGPYGPAYQAERKRSHIIDDPAEVPVWFLSERMRARLHAAEIALEARPAATARLHSQQHKVWLALRTIRTFLHSGDNEAGQRDIVLAGLLGATEVEIERERREHGLDADDVGTCARCHDPIVDPQNAPADDTALCRSCGDPGDPGDYITPSGAELTGAQRAAMLELTGRHLGERGITTPSELARLQAEQRIELARTHEWQRQALAGLGTGTG